VPPRTSARPTPRWPVATTSRCPASRPGLANLFPAAIARAGLLARPAGVALTSMLGYGGFLLGPPAIGFLASEFGLRVGLTTLAFLALAAAAIAYHKRNL
jgi:hypothetical protein